MLNNNDEANNKQDNTWDPTKAVHAEIGSQQYNRDGKNESATTASVQPDKLLKIPKEMRDRAQWCLAAPDKRPLQLNKANASPTDPTTWSTFDEIYTKAKEYRLGIGYVLAKDDPFVCIDLDVKDGNSKDKQGNHLPHNLWTPVSQLEWYRGIVLASKSYAELSSGGKGVHVWVKGELGEGRRGQGIEVYSQERFIVFTGDSIADIKYQHILGRAIANPLYCEPLPLQPRQHLVDAIVSEFSEAETKIDLVEVEATQSDIELWERANKAANSEKFVDLCSGQWQKYSFPSQSEADLALMSMLAFYSESNEQCRRMFRATVLGKREKAVKNDIYLDRTLKIIRGRQENEKKSAVEIDCAALKTQHQLKSKPVNDSEVIEFPPGVTGQLAEAYFNASPIPQQEISIAMALATLSAVAGRAFRTPTDATLSQFYLVIAHTGAGKDAIHKLIPKLLRSLNIPNVERFFTQERFVSGVALHKRILTEPGFLLLHTEFGKRLENIASRNNPSNQDQQFAAKLTETYEKDFLEGVSYSKGTDSQSGIGWPALSFIGESTPRTFYNSLTPNMMEDGFYSRFITILVKSKRPNLNRQACLDLGTLQDKFQALTAESIRINNAYPLEPRKVNFGSLEVEKLFDEFERECTDNVNIAVAENDDFAPAAWNRAHIKALKMASLLAVADCYFEPQISAQHAAWGIKLVRNDILTFVDKVNSGDVGDGDDARQKKVLEICQKVIRGDLKDDHKFDDKTLISRRVLQSNTCKLASFKNHKLGATKALAETIKSLVETGYLVKENMEPRSKADFYKLIST